MTPERPRLVAQATTDGGVVLGDGIDDRSQGDGRRQVDLDAGDAAGMGPQRGGQADDDDQRRTAVLTQSTGGRWRASSCHDSPPSADA